MARFPEAAMVAALIAFQRSGISLPGDVGFAGLTDEEEQGRGVEYMVNHGPPICDGTISSVTDGRCIIMGPGDLGVAHSIDEYIKIEDVENAAWIYGLTAMEYCR